MASYQDGFRIATNIGAMNAYNALNNINQQLQVTQLRLATGKRINSAADDPAGYTIGTKLNARAAGLTQALTNVGDAQSVLSTAEGGLQAISQILINIKTLVTQAGNAGLGSDEIAAIGTQIQDYAKEIDQIVQQTKFNGKQLLYGAGGNGFSGVFQVGSDSADVLSVALDSTNTAYSGAVDSSNIASVTSTFTFSGPATLTSTQIANALTSVDAGITNVSKVLQYVGSLESRLSFKQQVLNVSITNVDAAESRIMDADIAKEQVNATKLQILQQTATVQLAQANTLPSAVLRLFQ
ncbi:MAG: flagellin [Candidatus Kryptoniota bacterium]